MQARRMSALGQERTLHWISVGKQSGQQAMPLVSDNAGREPVTHGGQIKAVIPQASGADPEAIIHLAHLEQRPAVLKMATIRLAQNSNPLGSIRNHSLQSLKLVAKSVERCVTAW